MKSADELAYEYCEKDPYPTGFSGFNAGLKHAIDLLDKAGYSASIWPICDFLKGEKNETKNDH